MRDLERRVSALEQAGRGKDVRVWIITNGTEREAYERERAEIEARGERPDVWVKLEL